MRGLVADLPSPHPLLGVLPRVYAEDDLACRLTEAFDEALAPVFVALDGFPGYLDPALTPDDFLTWLGGWVAAFDHPELPEPRRRELVARAVELHARRGTAGGLAALVELVSGTSVTVEDSGGVAWSTEPGTMPPGRPDAEAVVRLAAPGDAARLVESVVAAVRPAHVRYRVESDSRVEDDNGVESDQGDGQGDSP